jgi:hypothetical protein
MNKKFVIYDSEGGILRAGDCPEHLFGLQAQDGEYILEGEADPQTDTVDVQAQAVIKGGRVVPPPAPESYVAVRRRLYPSVEDQLDMLWHSMDTSEVPKAEPFYSILKAVKEAVPKTGDEVFDVGSL